MEALSWAELGVLDWLAAHCHNGFLDVVMPAVTRLGDKGLIWILLGLGLLLLSKQERATGVQVLLALLLSVLLCNLLLKNMVQRVRPFELNAAVELLVGRPTDWSFPSGHTSSSFAAAAVLLGTRSRWRYAGLVLAAAIAFSRLYLYVHFPTDVLAGVLLGVGCGLLAMALWRRWGEQAIQFLQTKRHRRS